MWYFGAVLWCGERQRILNIPIRTSPAIFFSSWAAELTCLLFPFPGETVTLKFSKSSSRDKWRFLVGYNNEFRLGSGAKELYTVYAIYTVIYLFLLMVIFLLVFGFGRVRPKTSLGIILPGGVQSWWSSFWPLWRSSLLIDCLWRWSPMTQSTRLTPLMSLWTAWLSARYSRITTWSGSPKVGFTTTWTLIPVISETNFIEKLTGKISENVARGDRLCYVLIWQGLWISQTCKALDLPDNWLLMTLISMLNILL